MISRNYSSFAQTTTIVEPRGIHGITKYGNGQTTYTGTDGANGQTGS